MDAGKAHVKDGGDTQSAANLENSEGQKKVYHTVIRRAPSEGWSSNTQAGRLDTG